MPCKQIPTACRESVQLSGRSSHRMKSQSTFDTISPLLFKVVSLNGFQKWRVRIPPARFLDIPERLFSLKRFQRGGGVAGLDRERRNRFRLESFSCHRKPPTVGHLNLTSWITASYFRNPYEKDHPIPTSFRWTDWQCNCCYYN